MSPELNSRLFGSDAARGTVATWARVIESVEAIPEPFQNACGVLRDAGYPFPYTVFAPAITGLRRKTTEKLLGLVDDTIFIWERLGNRIVTTAYSIANVSDMELGQVLLYSWLTVSGAPSEGSSVSTKIEFNSVSFPYIEPFVKKLRPAAVEISEDAWQAERAKFDFLESASFKFMNYANGSLVRGETVLHTIWQPRIRRVILAMLGHSFNQILLQEHLTILTDKEVIFIGDDEGSKDPRDNRYGGVWQFVPLRHIVAVSVTEQAEGLRTLTINLAARDRQLSKVFEAARAHEIQHLRNELEKLTGITQLA